MTEAYRAAGIWIEPNLDSNRDRIANLSSWFTVSCGLLAVEVILWTISVAGYFDHGHRLSTDSADATAARSAADHPSPGLRDS